MIFICLLSVNFDKIRSDFWTFFLFKVVRCGYNILLIYNIHLTDTIFFIIFLLAEHSPQHVKNVVFNQDIHPQS